MARMQAITESSAFFFKNGYFQVRCLSIEMQTTAYGQCRNLKPSLIYWHKISINVWLHVVH